MSPGRPNKRRRIDNASHTLSQPFKSPFKTPLKDKTDTEKNLPARSDPPASERIEKDKICSATTPRPGPPKPIQTPVRRQPHTSSNTPSSSEYYALQKRHTHLLNQLSAARTSLETSNQAFKIETSNRDSELEALVQKWKSASRSAAEDVFAKARDRVNKMGGVAAMKDREKQSREKAWGWDDEPKKADDDGEAGEDDAGGGARLREEEYEGEIQDEREEGAKVAVDDDGDDEGYTMDMMLKTLNIELDVIGYDKSLQKWVD